MMKRARNPDGTKRFSSHTYLKASQIRSKFGQVCISNKFGLGNLLVRIIFFLKFTANIKKGKKPEGFLMRCLTSTTNDGELTVSEANSDVTQAEVEEAIIDDSNISTNEIAESITNDLITMSENTENSDLCPLIVSNFLILPD